MYNPSLRFDSYSKTFVEFTACDKWICFLWIEWPQQVAHILPQHNKIEPMQLVTYKSQNTHRIAENDNAITLDFTSLTLYKKTLWDLACVRKNPDRSSGKPTPGNHKCNKKRYESCSSVVTLKPFQLSFWNPNLPATLKGLVGGTRGWGSNVFFSYQEVFVPLKKWWCHCLWSQGWMNAPKKNPRLSRSMDECVTSLVNVWYMIAVVCHLYNLEECQNISYSLLILCAFICFFMSISMNQCIKETRLSPSNVSPKQA